ncbi:MAG: hypothetical protein ACI9JN_000345 [Bacteroidia bacterium]
MSWFNFDLRMKRNIGLTLLLVFMVYPNLGTAQINQDKVGAWYMYFFNTTFNTTPWGFQGDVQYRNWDMGGDLEQLLLRGGVTYKPQATDIKFTFGYGNITTGSYGSSNRTVSEHRIYQEALYPVRFGNRFHTNHRFRYEQRFADGQDLRTRYRYNLFLNIPLNSTEMTEKTVYLALYNELFVNGQRDIVNGNQVEIFDRNRLYGAVGYIIKKGLKVQTGFMQQTTNSWSKNQMQFSVHHKF